MIVWSEVTPKSVYLNRRRFLAGAMLAAAARRLTAGARLNVALKSPFSTTEQPTPYDDITHYNNFYEFGTDKDQPGRSWRRTSRPRPGPSRSRARWPSRGPSTSTTLMKLAPLEERIYRHRCVEGWSMVVPWIGFPLNALIKQVEPLSKRQVRRVRDASTTASQMPQAQRGRHLRCPYVEGLRMDEAMHPLTLLAVGLYGEVLPNQNGAPSAWWCPGSTASRASSRS